VTPPATETPAKPADQTPPSKPDPKKAAFDGKDPDIDDQTLKDIAEDLKSELGENYKDSGLEKMAVRDRINAMRVIKKAIAKLTPIAQTGKKNETAPPVGQPPAPITSKHKTFLELNEASSYDARMREQSSVLGKINKILNKKPN
jgi:hypothetical protein